MTANRLVTAASTIGAAVATFVFLLLGCSSQNPKSQHLSAAGLIQARDNLAFLSHPHARLNDEEDELILRCIHSKGFKNYPASLLDDDGRLTLQGFPVVRSRELMKRTVLGAGIERSLNQVDPVDGFASQLSTQDESRLQSIIDGDGSKSNITLPGGSKVSAPATGCYADARTQMFGSVDKFLSSAYLAQDATQGIDGFATRPSILAANDEYVACMKEDGYRVRSWAEIDDLANQHYKQNPSKSGKPDAWEVQLADADNTCLSLSQIPASYSDAVAEATEPWLRKNSAALADTAKVVAGVCQRSGAVTRADC